MATFEEWLATNYPDEKTVAKEKLLSTIDVNPQTAASSIKMAREEGIPIAFAPSEPDLNQKLQLSLRKNAQAIDGNPEFAKWLAAQPSVVAGAVSDDIPNLIGLSQVAQEFNNVLGAVASSAPAFNAGAWGLVRAAGDALPEVLGEPIVGLAKKYQEEQQKYVRDLMPQGDGALPDAVYSGLQSAGLSLMTLPIGLAGGGTAMLAPALTQVIGDSYSQGREAGLSAPAAMSHAIEMAGFEYITERIPAGRLIEDLVQGSGIGQTLIRQLAAEVPGEQLATLTQDLTEWANLNPDKSFGEFVRERPEAALDTLIATAVGSGTTVLTVKGVEKIASKLLREDNQIQEATQTGAALQKLAALSEASETAKRDVETFEGFLQATFQSSPVENVYIDANVLMQSGLAQQLAERSPTVAQQLPEAATGTIVKIPVSEVMGRFNQELVPLLAELRPTPEGLTQREAEAFMAERGPELEAEIERILTREAKDTAIAEQKAAIADEVAKAIVDTGRARPEVAKQYGQLVAAFYATMAERSGMSAKNLWEQRKVRVERGGSEESAFIQPAEPGVVRGSFDPNDLVIRLNKASDLTTFLHESGHLFFHLMTDLALLPNASESVIKDTDALLKWLGIEPTPELSRRDVWISMTMEEQRQYHETMARGFEVYLSEGKAPSVELQSAFAKFRSWLLNVYKALLQASKGNMGKALQAQLNPEVRAILDRMLATEEEIEAAEAANAMGGMFKTSEEAAQLRIDWERYQALGQAATDQAVSELGAKSIKDMKWLDNAKSRMLRELQKEANALRREARIEARREVLQDPVYRAWVFLTTPIRPSLEQKLKAKKNYEKVDPTKDSLLTAVAKLGGIKNLESELGYDREDIKDASGLTGLGVSYPISRKTGLSPDAMGEALWELGYLPEDEYGRYDVNDLDQKLGESIRGIDHYSNSFDYDAYFGIVLDVNEETGAMGGRLNPDLIDPKFVEKLREKGMLRKKGDDPELIAGVMGFSSGDEMVIKLADAMSPRDAIEQRTDQIMLERHSELATPEARNEAVNAALANDARTRMVATEMNALERATRGRKGQVTPAQAAKRFAEQIVARKRIIDIVPRIFSASAAKAAKRANKARKAGNIAEAAIEKRNELVNLFATKAATDSKEAVRKGLEYVKSLQKEARRKKIDIDYLDQIDQILEGYEFSRVSRRKLEQRENLQAWIAKQQDMGLEPDLPEEVVNRSLNVNFQTLTLEEFAGVIDSLKQIEHLGKLKNKLLTDAKNREVRAVVAEVQATIDANPRLKPIDDRTRTDIGTKLKQAFKAFTASHRKWSSLIYQIDGFKYGTLFDALVRTANERGAWEAAKQAELTQRIGKIMKNLPKTFGFSKGKFFNGIKMSLTQEERLAVALNWGNEGNRQRLLDGRGWTESGVKEVLNSLTKEEWDFVQGVWDTFESLRPEIAEKERRVVGKEPEWIEASPVETAFGTYQGGYYPIVYDYRENSEAAKKERAEEARRQLEGARSVAQTRRNFVKMRAKQVKNRPVELTMNAMFRGLTDVVHDLAYHEWAIDANRLVDAISEPVRKAYGFDVMDQIVTAKNAIIAGENQAPGRWDFVVRHIRVGSMVAGLGFNLTNALMQPLGLTQSIVRVGPRWMAKGVTQFVANPEGLSKEVLEKSVFMRNRARTRDREINDLRSRLRKTNETRKTIEDLMFAPMMLMQLSVDVPTWKAGYDKAISDGADEAAAIARADAEVIASQGSGQVKDMAEVQRGPEWKKLFTVFYGYFNTAYNLGAERVAQTSFKNPLQIASLAVDFLLLYSVPSVLAYALKEAVSGDDDDEEEIAKRLAVEQISYMMGLMVGVRELTTVANLMAAAALDTEAPFAATYQGPAGVRLIAELQKFAQQSSQGEIDRALFKALISVAGIALHLPSAQVNRTIDGIIALDEGETENPAAVIGGAR